MTDCPTITISANLSGFVLLPDTDTRNPAFEVHQLLLMNERGGDNSGVRNSIVVTAESADLRR